MQSPFSSSKSASNEEPTCDSDEEVFFGPVTTKEIQKASKLKRRTQLYFPGLDWKPRHESQHQKSECPLIEEQDEELRREMDDHDLSEDSVENHELSRHKEDNRDRKQSMSQDSIENLSFEGKTQEESEGPVKHVTEKTQSLFQTPQDSLEDVNKSVESSFENDTNHVTFNTALPPDSVRPGNSTFTVESEEYSHCGSVASMDAAESHTSGTQQDPKDGLSILSEAALYHASLDSQSHQSYNSSMVSDQQADDTVQTQQSLEDRMKEYNPDADDVDKQQLTDSIMYATGRASTAFHSVMQEGLTSVELEEEVQSSDNQNVHGSPNVSQHLYVTSLPSPYDIEKQKLTESIMYESVNMSDFNFSKHHLPNESHLPPYMSNDDASELSESLSKSVNSLKIQDALCSSDTDGQYTDSKDYISSDTEENHARFSVQSETAGELKDVSVASSASEPMNDTLEEYEMMMRYGVDYIYGREGQKKEEKVNIEEASGEVGKHSSPGKIQDSSSSYHEADDLVHTPKPVQRTAAVSPSRRSPMSRTNQKYISNAALSSPQRNLSPKPSAKRTTPIQSPLRKVLTPRNSPIQHGNMAKDTAGATPRMYKTQSSGIPRIPRVAPIPPTERLRTPSPQRLHLLSPRSNSATKCNPFKKPLKPPVSSSRIPKSASVPSLNTCGQRSNQKILDNIQSPVSAYIHNSPSPVLVTNVKAKQTERGAFQNEMYARALWRAGEGGTHIPKLKTSQVPNSENINPNAGCGLPAVKYTKAPCIKLDDAGKARVLPRMGDKITRLLDSPSPQVIKHEGRLKVDFSSPQLAAVVQSVSSYPDDSLLSITSSPGDISVCVTKTASRSDTLGFRME